MSRKFSSDNLFNDACPASRGFFMVMNMSKIEWTQRTWNPVTGCTKISQGCKHCYAERMAKRLKAMSDKGQSTGYHNGFAVTLHPDRLNDPLTIKQPSTFFVCSMSDLFHDAVPTPFILQVMAVIHEARQHTFQILTKRAERLSLFALDYGLPDNAHVGVTIENRDNLDRLRLLKLTQAKKRFLSCEPLLEDLGALDLEGIHWVIVGGENAPKARAMNPLWVRNIRDQCHTQNVPFFFKQWGTWGEDGAKRNKKANGRELDGQIHSQLPTKDAHLNHN